MENWQLVIIYIVIIGLLIGGGFATYKYVLQPKLQDYVLQKQIEAKDITLTAILQSIQEKGMVEIQDTTGNKIILVPYQGEGQ